MVFRCAYCDVIVDLQVKGDRPNTCFRSGTAEVST